MMTSFELEHLARQADMGGHETRADRLYMEANDAREIEDDMAMALPRGERYALYGRWCRAQEGLYHEDIN